jgi:hypothetical protein
VKLATLDGRYWDVKVNPLMDLAIWTLRSTSANGYAVEDRVSMGKELSENIGF